MPPKRHSPRPAPSPQEAEARRREAQAEAEAERADLLASKEADPVSPSPNTTSCLVTGGWPSRL